MFGLFELEVGLVGLSLVVLTLLLFLVLWWLRVVIVLFVCVIALLVDLLI